MNKADIKQRQPRTASAQPPRVGSWYGIQQVAAKYGISDTEVRRQVRQGRFPKPVLMGERLARWSDAMLDAHDRALLAQLDRRVAA